MAGGPISGGAFGISKDTNIIIPTILQIASDTMNWFTSLTCLYDRYWQVNEETVTLPICVFHVKKISTTVSNETAKKRVLLYEQKDPPDTSDRLRENVMRTIMDNVVKQPTTYNMDIIVPFQPGGKFVSGVKVITDMIKSFTEMLGDPDSSRAGRRILGQIGHDWQSTFSTTFSLLETFNTVTDSLNRLPGNDGAAYINMNSLEAMAVSSRALCMKMWTGYNYKFVIVTGMSFDKQPAEDDVFRATLQLTEMPVLTLSPPLNARAPELSRSWFARAASATQEALVAPLIKATGVTGPTAAGDMTPKGTVESAKDAVQNILGGVRG